MRAPSVEIQKLSEMYKEGKEKLEKELLLDEILQKVKKTWRVVVNEYNVSEYTNTTRPTIKRIHTKKSNEIDSSNRKRRYSEEPPSHSPRNKHGSLPSRQ